MQEGFRLRRMQEGLRAQKNAGRCEGSKECNMVGSLTRKTFLSLQNIQIKFQSCFISINYWYLKCFILSFFTSFSDSLINLIFKNILSSAFLQRYDLPVDFVRVSALVFVACVDMCVEKLTTV